MEPTFRNGQLLIINRLSYLQSEPERGQIVVFSIPTHPNRDYIKRIVGLPGEIVELRNGLIYINGQRLDEPYVIDPCSHIHCPNSIWQIGKDEYFVMGDNRNNSRDSRTFGSISRSTLIGEAVVRYWPLSDINWLHQNET
jgi:signal peptidase I